MYRNIRDTYFIIFVSVPKLGLSTSISCDPRRIAMRIFQRVHPAISLRRSSSNEKVILKVTALQREIAASPLFPVPAWRAERKEKKKNGGETKNKKKFVCCPFPSVATRVIDRTVVDNLSRAFGTRSGPFLSGRVARKSDNPICGRHDFRPREPTSAVMYEDTLMLPHRGFTSYMLMNNLVTNSVPPGFPRRGW